MERYIRSTAAFTVDDVWDAIPKEYRPYIEDVTIVPQYSTYRNKEVITYNCTFKTSVWEGDKNPMVGIFHAEDVPTLVQGIVDYLGPKFPEIGKKIMNRWHPRRGNSW